MQERFPPSWNELLDILQAGDEPLPLTTIAARSELAPSTVHRHLDQMGQIGLVERTGRRKDARYAPRPFVSTFWTAPAQPIRARSTRPTWLRLEWTHPARVDWRFPLVSRLPDVDAQQTILRLLDEAWKRGILTPWLTASQTVEFGEDVPERRRDEIRRKLADPAHHEGTTWVVYGSTARGDARTESDIDLLVILPAEIPQNQPQPPLEQNIERLVDDINLGATRSIDLVTVARDALFDDLPTPLRNAILREGSTVFSTFGGGEFIETLREGSKPEG